MTDTTKIPTTSEEHIKWIKSSGYDPTKSETYLILPTQFQGLSTNARKDRVIFQVNTGIEYLLPEGASRENLNGNLKEVLKLCEILEQINPNYGVIQREYTHEEKRGCHKSLEGF